MEETQGSRYPIEQENMANSQRNDIAQKILDIEQQMDQVQTNNAAPAVPLSYNDEPDISEEGIATFSTSSFASVFDHLLAAFALFPIFLAVLLFMADAVGVFSREIWFRPFFLYITPAIYFMVLFGYLNRPKQDEDEPAVTQESIIGRKFTRPSHVVASVAQPISDNSQDHPAISELQHEEKIAAEKQFMNFAKGQQAEDKFADLLTSILEDDWTLFRNVSLKVIDGSTENIDAILVGPTGVFALEVKSRSGNYRYSGKLWEYKNQAGEWQRIKGDVPSQQAKRNATRLHTYLAECNIDTQVEPRLVWANKERLQLVVPPEVPVWFVDEGADLTADIDANYPIPYETMEHIKKVIAIRLE